jgi:hypothetical protein
MDETLLYDYKLALQILAVCSIFASMLMIFNLLAVFVSNSDGHYALSHVYNALAGMVVGDILSNWGYLSVYRVSTGSTLCDIQGWSIIFGAPTTWLWTLQLAFLLFSIAVWENLPDNRYAAHFLCWGVPFVFACGQFGVGGFGTHPHAGYDICAERDLDGDNTKSFIYHMITFYGLFLVTVFTLIAMLCVVQYLKWKRDARTLSHLFIMVQQILKLYPFILLICWVPHAVIKIFEISTSSSVYFLTVVMKNLHGILVPLVYFYQSPNARDILKKSLFPGFWFANSSMRFSFISFSTGMATTLLGDSRRSSSSTRSSVQSKAMFNENELVPSIL